jgi:CHAT domain-containing protein/tetratricopeptide (TPR) repeat protein
MLEALNPLSLRIAAAARLFATLGLACVLAACATGPVPGEGKRYGFELDDTQEALQRGEGREALSYYEREARELERRGLRLEAAKAHAAIAFIARPLGAYQKGIRSGLRALELLKLERETIETVTRQASVYSVVGHTYRLAGDLKEARRHFQEGLELTSGMLHVGRILFWSGLFSRALASLAFSQGDYQLALQHGRESVRFLENRLARLPSSRSDQLRHNTRRNLAFSWALVGNAQRRLGNLGEAETSLGQALEIAKELRAQEIEAQTLASLGWVANARGDFSRALGHFQEALALATRLNHVPQLIFIHNGIGRSHAGQRRFDEALAAFRRALELVEDVRGQLQEAGLRSGFLEDKQVIYHGAVRSALALRKPAEAFSFAERGRARAFLDLLGSQTTLSKGKTRALVEEEVRLRARLSEAQALAQDVTDVGDSARARQQVEAAEQAYRVFLERVRKENLEQASLMTVEPVTLQEVQGLLPEGTMLLEYLVTEQVTLLWVIDRQRVQVVRLPVPRASLVTEVRAFRQAIAEHAPLEQVQGLAGMLYERLLRAARPRIRGERLLIVPHDVLHYLPFGALRSPEGRWVVEEYTLATLPSASVLKYLRGKGEGASERVLAVGNPDLGPALTLRYAEREARSVVEQFPGTRVLIRQEATEAKAKALSGEVGLLHFATHGELSEQDPLSSALLLVPEGAEDGRLEVRELFGLELTARLVVLSACETGLGKLSKGDELVGLQRAFLYAGTPAVVTTLWKVDDRASFVLMREFYEQLKARGPAEALRQAQRAIMTDFPHPFFWAAFGFTGVPR